MARIACAALDTHAHLRRYLFVEKRKSREGVEHGFVAQEPYGRVGRRGGRRGWFERARVAAGIRARPEDPACSRPSLASGGDGGGAEWQRSVGMERGEQRSPGISDIRYRPAERTSLP